METLSEEQLRAIGTIQYGPDEFIPSPLLRKESGARFHLTEETDLFPFIPHRHPFSNKGNYGHALLIAGKRGMAGAALLSARACLRSGVGLLTVHTPSCNLPVIQASLPEAIVQPDCNEDSFSALSCSSTYTAVGAGPGIGTSPQTGEALFSLIKNTGVPLLLDADALNLLACNPEQMKRLPQGTLLTPHPREFDRLAGSSATAAERLRKALRLARDHQIYIVLKGHYSAVVTPAGESLFNTTGNGGMATAGSGDVLTGILLALLAQGISPQRAAQLGVYIHGLAGDMAAEEIGEISLMAGDIVRYLPEAWQRLQKKV